MGYNPAMPGAQVKVAISSATLNKAERLSRARRPATMTAAAAQKSFAEVLQAVGRKPVTVTHKGKPAAVLLSVRRYQEWMRFLEEMEDSMWLAAALESEKDELVSQEEGDAFLRKLHKKNGR